MLNMINYMFRALKMAPINNSVFKLMELPLTFNCVHNGTPKYFQGIQTGVSHQKNAHRNYIVKMYISIQLVTNSLKNSSIKFTKFYIVNNFHCQLCNFCLESRALRI